MPAVSSSLISLALEKLGDLPAGDRALLAGHCPSLAGHLAGVPDPRDPRGVRHTLTSLLLAAVAAVLAGARSFTAVGEWAADAPPRVLAALGVRYDPLAGCFRPPDEAAFRRVLEALDAAALEAAVGSWLAARQQAGRLPPDPGRRERRAVAVDGKALRGTRHASADGQARHLLAAADQQAGAVLAQAEVDGKTNEITGIRAAAGPAGPGRGGSHRRRAARPARARPVPGHRASTRTTSWPSRTTSPACTPSSRTCPGGRSRPASTPANAVTAAPSGAPSRSPPSPPGSPSPTPPRPSRSGAAAGR